MNTTTSNSSHQTPPPIFIIATSPVTKMSFYQFNSTVIAEPVNITPSGVIFGVNASNVSTVPITDFVSNTSDTGISEGGSMLVPELYLTFFTVFYAYTVICGTVGNFLVIAALVCSRGMRSPCNLLIANISSVDFLVSIFVTPIRIAELYIGWPLGKWGCYILLPVQDILVAVSVLTHTVLALERRRAIVSPFKPKLSLKKVKFLIVGMWLSCIVLLGVPELVPVQYAKWKGRYYCWPDWPSINHRRAFELYLVVLFILAPLAVQCTAYGHIVCVQQRANNLEMYGTESNTAQEFVRHRMKQKKKLVKMLIMMMITFQVCYIPHGVIMIVKEFAPESIDAVLLEIASAAILIVFYIKHVVNPLFLWFMSQEFHNVFVALFTCSTSAQPLPENRVSNANETFTVLVDMPTKTVPSAAGIRNEAYVQGNDKL